jgi:nucleoside-diphosphate-sugar epimerase
MSGERAIVLFGASGQIGSALRHSLEVSGSGRSLVSFSWNNIVSRDGLSLRPAFVSEITEFVRTSGGVDFVFTSGQTNPNASAEQIAFSNYAFPNCIFQATSSAETARYLTIGTVFETVAGHAAGNNYTRSKLRLAERMAQLSLDSGPRRFLHVRLHTVYGGTPKPYMFLGQIAQALETGSELLMTSGEQFREYHHAADIAGCLALLLDGDWSSFGTVVEINSGAPVRLVALATAVFRHYGRNDLLKIGALSRPVSENFDRIFPRSPLSLLPFYRDPILGVIDTLDQLVGWRHLG